MRTTENPGSKTILTKEQIEFRRQGIGGSDQGILAGLSNRATARELYSVKRGEIGSDDVYAKAFGAGGDDDLLSFLGSGIEPLLAARYESETGNKVYQPRKQRIHPELDWWFGLPDRLVRGGKRRNKRTGAPGDKRGLEIKMRVRDDDWGRSGTDMVPDDVLLQSMHYIEQYDYDLWDVAALIGGADFRVYTIPRDQSLIHKMIDQAGGFWDAVQRGIPPEIDFEHRTANALIDVLHPGTDGKVIDLPPEALTWHESLEDANKWRTQYGAVADVAKAHLKRLMGDAAVGMLPDGGMYNRKEQFRAGHTVADSRFTTIRYKRPPRTRS